MTDVRRPSRYLAVWRRLPWELPYLLVGFPKALLGFAVIWTMFWAGIATLFTVFIGLALIVASLYVARGFGSLELVLLRWTRRPVIPHPEWQDARAKLGFLGWVRGVVGNGHYWLSVLHVAVLDFAVATITSTIAFLWLVLGLGGSVAWLWMETVLADTDGTWVTNQIWIAISGNSPKGDPLVVNTVVCVVIGLLLLAALPWVVRWLTTLRWLIARGLLGAWKSDALTRELISVSAARRAAVSAEGASLRRLERDIHDGPQQRLVRLQMDLAAAERQIGSDPDRARALIAEAMQQSRDALDELRALSRGFAPPILLDRGLVAALQSAAVRSSIPARVVDELPNGFRVPREIERNAYFLASEAMANAVKHSAATGIEVRVSSRADDSAGRTWLVVEVLDDGVGGVRTIAGHGISGLEERLRGLGGTLGFTSPAGGPTAVVARLPLPASGESS